MEFSQLSLPAVLLILLASLVLLTTPDWRGSIFSLAIQYLGAFLLVALSWPLILAVVKLVAGWMAASLLAVSRSAYGRASPTPSVWPSGRLLRVFAAALVLLVVLSLAPRTIAWVPGLGLEQAWGGLLLVGMGVLQVGFSAQPLRVVLGMLTVLSGFEILYAAVESATLVAGLLAVVNLGLAMVGAYLLASVDLRSSPR